MNCQNIFWENTSLLLLSYSILGIILGTYLKRVQSHFGLQVTLLAMSAIILGFWWNLIYSNDQFGFRLWLWKPQIDISSHFRSIKILKHCAHHWMGILKISLAFSSFKYFNQNLQLTNCLSNQGKHFKKVENGCLITYSFETSKWNGY